MRILLTADLHFRTDWFHWLMEQALSYDLVCIAGDLLDMFNVESPKGQAREVSMLIRELADIVPVAICSGITTTLADLYRSCSTQKWSGRERRRKGSLSTFCLPIGPITLFPD